ncbi:MAG: hypothetical protein BHV88_20140 [Clostridiales bacterium 41_12_two_minus]|nr:MAG: hypothetical protein BHV88_20140 [Clostridiales bacterium 41_12_two_minus]
MELKIRKSYTLLAFAIFISENCFYLFEDDIYKDIGLVIVLAWSLWTMIKFKNKKNPPFRFGMCILFTLVLMLTSSLQSRLLYNQSILLGIRPQRYWITWAMTYFPIRKLMYLDYITFDDLKGLLYKIGILELILYTGQYLLAENIVFLHVHSYSTYSTSRFYFSNILLCLVLFMRLNDIFNKQNVKRNMFFIAWIILDIIQIGKMRMTFIAVSTAILLGIIMWRRGGNYKILSVFVIAIGVGLVSGSEVVQSILPALNGTGRSDTLEIREIGRNFYLDVIKNHPILGGGYINTQWRPAYIASRQSEGITWVDNGIFGFMYFYGGIGLAWAMVLFGKTLSLGRRVKNNMNEYVYLLTPIYWLVAMVSEAHWYFISFMVFVLLICLMEDRLDKYDVERAYE